MGAKMVYLLQQLVAEAADHDPDQLALVCRDSRLTYGELEQRSNALAHALIERGVERGDRVGVFANKSVETGVAMYGVMAAGGAYVPLDPTSPPSRLAYVIQDCGIHHVIAENRQRPTVAGLERLGVKLDTVIGLTDADIAYPAMGWTEIGSRGEAPRRRVMEQDLCYVLYTSGSTGVPKGIMHTHRSALSWANVTASEYSIGDDDVLSNYAPIHFDLSTLDFFGGAKGRATVVMIPEEHMKLSASLASVLEQSQITLFYTVPLALVQLSTPGVLDRRDFSSLKRILFGGEPMPLKHLHSLMRKLPETRFFNVYGPTEVNGVTHFAVPGPPPVDGDALPIGLPYENVEALVVDEEDRPVPQGKVGELAIRSATLMRGYWGRPDLNERAFYFRERFDGLPEVFHRTGDLVHQDRDDVLHFHGRKDRQIKSRGYRVELDEVEAVLITHTDVVDAAVYGVPTQDGTTEIQAAVTLTRASAATPSSLRTYLAETLPGYAVPTTLTVLEDFPRTTTGKIDRRTIAEATTALSTIGEKS
jgi:amino acid adenylation domain-containing protein